MRMTETNITEMFKEFLPDDILNDVNSETCYFWCLQQQVVHSNNLELQMLLFPLASFIFMLLYFEAENFKVLEDYKNFFIYMAKVFLIVFFAAYLLIVRMRLIY